MADAKPETDFEYEGRLFKLPLFAYLLEPVRQPGFMRTESGEILLPLWTDRDLVETYVNRIGSPVTMSLLELHTRKELVRLLQSVASEIRYAVFDSDGTTKYKATVAEIKPLLNFLTKSK